MNCLCAAFSDGRQNVFDVEIYLTEGDERMKPGMSANSQIIIDEIPNVLSVPIDAITIENENTWVNDSDGDPIEIITGKSSSDFIIVQEGLDDGDEIQLSGDGDVSEQSNKKRKPKKKGSSSRTIIMM